MKPLTLLNYARDQWVQGAGQLRGRTQRRQRGNWSPPPAPQASTSRPCSTMPAPSAARRCASSPSTNARICSRRSGPRSWPARRSCTSSTTPRAPPRSDGWIDIEAAPQRSSPSRPRGRRELPNQRILVDGQMEAALEGGTFVGQHVYTSLRASRSTSTPSTFPVWGMLEKLGPDHSSRVPGDREARLRDRLPREHACPDHDRGGHLPRARCS
jgi:hypothetical protein